jgi:MerR family transcriptional regulator/heat shock protein HspR
VQRLNWSRSGTIFAHPEILEVIMHQYSRNQIRYTRTMVIQLAEISPEFLEKCEVEQLIETSTVGDDEPSYSAQDIRHLALIRRLHEVLGIDMQDLEVVIHLRSQLMDLQDRMQEMERQWIAREEQLLNEMIDLRKKLAEDAHWK